MVRPRLFSDDELVGWVRADRAELGACTTATLHRRSGYSAEQINRRINALVRSGQIVRDARIPGSIRPAAGTGILARSRVPH